MNSNPVTLDEGDTLAHAIQAFCSNRVMDIPIVDDEGDLRGGLLLSLLVLPLYVPTLIFGAELARRGIVGMDVGTPMSLLLGITFASIALLPFASAAVLKINLR